LAITMVPRFWNKDQEQRPSGSLLIIGGGDGAVQDFLLAATGLSAGNIYDAAIPHDLQAGIEPEIQSAEDQAHRAGLWAATQHTHAIYASLELVHETLVAKLLEDRRVEENLDRLLRPSSPDSRARGVVIAHTCSHFGLVYALNRFLALLIIRHLESRAVSTKPRRVNVRADDDKWASTGSNSHKVRFRAVTCTSDPGEESEDEFDDVIVRIGVELPPGIKASFASPGGRQALPYSVF
jgi:hypothetical protein